MKTTESMHATWSLGWSSSSSRNDLARCGWHRLSCARSIGSDRILWRREHDMVCRCRRRGCCALDPRTPERCRCGCGVWPLGTRGAVVSHALLFLVDIAGQHEIDNGLGQVGYARLDFWGGRLGGTFTADMRRPVVDAPSDRGSVHATHGNKESGAGVYICSCFLKETNRALFWGLFFSLF
jgi:hypothetical protein